MLELLHISDFRRSLEEIVVHKAREMFVAQL